MNFSLRITQKSETPQTTPPTPLSDKDTMSMSHGRLPATGQLIQGQGTFSPPPGSGKAGRVRPLPGEATGSLVPASAWIPLEQLCEPLGKNGR